MARSRGLGDVYKRQTQNYLVTKKDLLRALLKVEKDILKP
jgi:hypothetical protein